MDDLLQTMLDTPPHPGAERVTYPGIPLHPEVIAWFDTITAELGIPQLVR